MKEKIYKFRNHSFRLSSIHHISEIPRTMIGKNFTKRLDKR